MICSLQSDTSVIIVYNSIYSSFYLKNSIHLRLRCLIRRLLCNGSISSLRFRLLFSTKMLSYFLF